MFEKNLETISTDQAPGAIGPYSQAQKIGDLLFISGQIPLNPATGEMVEGDVEAATHQVMKNLQAIAKAAGADLNRVVKTTIFLADMEDFQAVNGVYAEYFGDHRPARATIQVAALPKYAQVEIEAIVAL